MNTANALSPSATSLSTSRSAVLGCAGLLAAAVIAAYANSLSGAFVYDDLPAIVDNPTLRSLASAWTPPHRSGLPVAGRPLVNVSLAFNFLLGGLHPQGYHAVNIAIHLGAALALFGLVRRTLLLPTLSAQFTRISTVFATAVALLWALHPLQTEAVAYVVQRAESLMGLFYLLTLYCVARAVASPGRRLWTVLAITCCACGMASKEVMVSAPLIALAYDRAFAAGTFREAWTVRRGLYLGLAFTWIILIALLFTSADRGGTAGFGTGVPWWAYLLTQSRAIVHYLRLAVWPQPLVFDYGTEIVTHPLDVVAPFLSLVVLTAATAWAFVRRPRQGFLGLFFFAVLAPSSSVVPIASEVMAEHRMYLGLAPIVMLAALLAYRACGRYALIPAAAAALALGRTTAERNVIYRSELALWSDTVAHAPANPRAHFNLAEVLGRRGNRTDAIAHYREAVRLRPNFASAHSNLSVALCEIGQFAEAQQHAEIALRDNPQLPEAHSSLGNAYYRRGELENALREYLEAVRLNPANPDFQSNLGTALTQLGRLAEATEHYQAAIRLKPDNPQSHFFLGNTLARMGRFSEAAAAFERALVLDPDFVRAKENLLRVRVLQNR